MNPRCPRPSRCIRILVATALAAATCAIISHVSLAIGYDTDNSTTDNGAGLTAERADFVAGLASLHQDNPRLSRMARGVLQPPSHLSYSFRQKAFSPNYAFYVNRIFNSKQQGFYVDVGVGDGETNSNTIFLETELYWHGLLVEDDEATFADLKAKNRKALHLNGCVSPTRHAEVFAFYHVSGSTIHGLVDAMPTGTLKRLRKKGQTVRTSEKFCFPLLSIIRALDNPVIDYMNLSVGGAELAVLLTVPWSDVHVTAMTVSLENSERCQTDRLLAFMASQGYKEVQVFTENKLWTDVLLVRHDMMSKLNLSVFQEGDK